jgi:OOP family OmpA-OmpF porin
MNLKLVTLLFLIVFSSARAQKTVGYYFDAALKCNTPGYPDLIPLGKPGVLTEDYLPELNIKKNAYAFERNCGLQFDNAKANGLLNNSYTIEIYFRFDKLNSWKRVLDFKNRTTDWGCYMFNGKLNFYNLFVSELAPVRENEYTHYIITRNAETQEVRIYADGEVKITFIDTNNYTQISSDQKLNFFFDDLKVTDEASAGAVALIKLSDHVLDPNQSKHQFDSLLSNIQNSTTAVTEKGKTQTLIQVFDTESKQALSQFSYRIKSSKFESDGNILAGTALTKIFDHNSTVYISIKSKGYVSHEDSFIINSSTSQTLVIPLEKIKVGKTITLQKIQFERGQYNLLPESYPELDKLVDLMNDNETMVIELDGHTDNQGDAKLNIELSEQRVNATKDYLISKGIDKKRIIGKGFGGSKPIASNAKEETRKLNRRVEMKIIKE